AATACAVSARPGLCRRAALRRPESTGSRNGSSGTSTAKALSSACSRVAKSSSSVTVVLLQPAQRALQLLLDRLRALADKRRDFGDGQAARVTQGDEVSFVWRELRYQLAHFGDPFAAQGEGLGRF